MFSSRWVCKLIERRALVILKVTETFPRVRWDASVSGRQIFDRRPKPRAIETGDRAWKVSDTKGNLVLFTLNLIAFRGATKSNQLVWTPVRYVTLRDRRSAASLRHKRFGLWTEDLPGMNFAVAQKLSGIVCYTRPYVIKILLFSPWRLPGLKQTWFFWNIIFAFFCNFTNFFYIIFLFEEDFIFC